MQRAGEQQSGAAGPRPQYCGGDEADGLKSPGVRFPGVRPSPPVVRSCVLAGVDRGALPSRSIIGRGSAR
jgi:hypothetical protein